MLDPTDPATADSSAPAPAVSRSTESGVAATFGAAVSVVAGFADLSSPDSAADAAASAAAAAAAAAAASFAALRRAAAAFAAAERTGSGVRFCPLAAGLRVELLDRGFFVGGACGSTTASGASEEEAADLRRFVEGVDEAFEVEDDVDREDFEVRGVEDVVRAGDFFAAVLPLGADSGVCSEGVDGICASSFWEDSEVTA